MGRFSEGLKEGVSSLKEGALGCGAVLLLGPVAIGAFVASCYFLESCNRKENPNPNLENPPGIERKVDDENETPKPVRLPYPDNPGLIDEGSFGPYPETLYLETPKKNYQNVPEFRPRKLPPVEENDSDKKGLGIPPWYPIPRYEPEEPWEEIV